MAHTGNLHRTVSGGPGEAVAKTQEEGDHDASDGKCQTVGTGKNRFGIGTKAGSEFAGEYAGHAAGNKCRQRRKQHIGRKHQRDRAEGIRPDVKAEEYGIDHGQQPVHAHHQDDGQGGSGQGRQDWPMRIGVGPGYVGRHSVLHQWAFRSGRRGSHCHQREMRGEQKVLKTRISP